MLWHCIKVLNRIADIENITLEEIGYITSIQLEESIIS